MNALPIERIDLYHEYGEKNGAAIEKRDAHRLGLLHKSICVWIVNARGDILLQQRSAHVMFPNLWDISFSGHIRSGESALEAILREGREELGVEIDVNKLHYLFSCRVYGTADDYIENEIDDVYLYRDNLPIDAFNFCDQEVQRVAYIPIDALRAMVDRQDAHLVAYALHYRFLLDTLSVLPFSKEPDASI